MAECPQCKANREAREATERAMAERQAELAAEREARAKENADLKAEKEARVAADTERMKLSEQLKAKPPVERVIVGPSEAAKHYDACPECKTEWEALLKSRLPKVPEKPTEKPAEKAVEKSIPTWKVRR